MDRRNFLKTATATAALGAVAPKTLVKTSQYQFGFTNWKGMETPEYYCGIDFGYEASTGILRMLRAHQDGLNQVLNPQLTWYTFWFHPGHGFVEGTVDISHDLRDDEVAMTYQATNRFHNPAAQPQGTEPV